MSDLSPSPARPTRVRYGVLALLCTLAMITYLDRVCFGAAAPTIADELGLSGVEDLKWAFTSFAIAYAIFEIPVGWLGDRLGPRGTLIRIVAWWSVFTILTGLVGLRVGGIVLGGLGTMVVVRLLFGAGEAGAFPNIARAIHNWFPVATWPAAQGFIWMSSRLMGGITPLIWALLVSGTAYTSAIVDWRGAFLFFGLIGFVWCAVFAMSFRNRPAEHPGTNEAERQLVGDHVAAEGEHGAIPWRGMLRSRTLWALCIMYFSLAYGWYFHVTYLPGYMKERYAVADESIIGAIYKGGPLWVGAAGCLVGGLLASRLGIAFGNRGRGRRVLGVTALSVCVVGWLAARVAPNEHVFFLAVSAAAFFNDLVLGAAWATCQDIGRRHAAVTAATMNTTSAVAAALAGWLTGSIVQWTKAARPGDAAAEIAGYEIAMLTYAGAYIIAAACWLFIDPDRPIVDAAHSGASGDSA
jgi:MFS family permease